MAVNIGISTGTSMRHGPGRVPIAALVAAGFIAAVVFAVVAAQYVGPWSSTNEDVATGASGTGIANVLTDNEAFELFGPVASVSGTIETPVLSDREALEIFGPSAGVTTVDAAPMTDLEAWNLYSPSAAVAEAPSWQVLAEQEGVVFVESATVPSWQILAEREGVQF